MSLTHTPNYMIQFGMSNNRNRAFIGNKLYYDMVHLMGLMFGTYQVSALYFNILSGQNISFALKIGIVSGKSGSKSDTLKRKWHK